MPNFIFKSRNNVLQISTVSYLETIYMIQETRLNTNRGSKVAKPPRPRRQCTQKNLGSNNNKTYKKLINITNNELFQDLTSKMARSILEYTGTNPFRSIYTLILIKITNKQVLAMYFSTEPAYILSLYYTTLGKTTASQDRNPPKSH